MISAFFIRNPVFAGCFINNNFSCWTCFYDKPSNRTISKSFPPQIVVSTNYPGASANTIAKTVAAPLEQQINGAKDMIYMNSFRW